MTVDDGISNPTSNRPFQDVLAKRVSRRTVMTGSLATAAVAFFGASGVVDAKGQGKGNGKGLNTGPLVDFENAPNLGGPLPTVSDDYEYQVLIPWGTPLFSGVPDIDGGRPASAADAERQVGIGHDGMWLFPVNGNSSNHGVLCINHEFGDNGTVLGGDPSALPDPAEAVKISQAAHGVSVVQIRKRGGTWEHVVDSRYNRRITANSPVAFDGPVAGSALLGGATTGMGTVNNCGNGYTPWGTYLTCEENFNGYFGFPAGYTPTEEQARYGFSSGGFGYEWWMYDSRFDLQATPGEENKFGWITEIDPLNPSKPPMKHTALGRFKHEGFAFATGKNGEAVGYMGDDERFDYIYKFVSAGAWRTMLGEGRSPFSEGKLYAARFDDDGTGEWLELSRDADPALAARFATDAELLTYARIAADIVGATPMDRPEWTTVAPNGEVYCTLTNNSARTVADAANPEAPNNNGHIIRWRDADDHIGSTFEWDIFVLATDTLGEDYFFTDPDGLWADGDGRVFIQTDGGQPNGANNQMLVADTAGGLGSSPGEIRRLFAGVSGDEITGIAITPDRKTLFCNTQHPGNGDPTATNFPVMNAVPDGVTIPRDCTIVLTRKDRGIVGS